MFCFKLAQNPHDLHRKAAAFYQQTGTSKDILEALHHLLKAGAHQEGAALIMDYSGTLINEGYASQLLSFCKDLDSLPAYNNRLMEIEGDIYLLRGEYDMAAKCFRTPLEKASNIKKASLYRKLGEVYERKREYRIAETLFLKGLDMLKEQDVVEQGEILVKLAEIYAALNESDRALSCCEHALTCFSQSEYKKGIVHVYNQMGEILRFIDTEKALEFLFSSLEINEALGDVRLSASILVSIGTVLYESGQSQEAVTYYEKSLKISEQIGDMVGIARCCNNIGVSYALEGKWPHAMECYYRTLSICLKINDKKGIAFSYSNVGRAYSRLGLLEKAREYFFASLKLRKELSDTREIAYLYYNIGLTFQDMGDFHKAFEWITKSLHLRESVDYVLGIAYCYATMGELYGEMGEYDAALDCFEKILPMYGGEEGNWMVATAKVFSAKVYVAKREYEKALQLIEGTVEVLEAAGNRGVMVETHQITAEAHLRLGNQNQAMKHAEISLQHALQMGSIKLEGKARRIRGVLFGEMGEYERAEDELRLSMRLLKRYTHELATTYVEFALLCRRKGSEKRKYRVLLQKALGMFTNAGATAHEALCRGYLEQF
jgi:tetratricopeptide (TPR) repeat protein